MSETNTSPGGIQGLVQAFQNLDKTLGGGSTTTTTNRLEISTPTVHLTSTDDVLIGAIEKIVTGRKTGMMAKLPSFDTVWKALVTALMLWLSTHGPAPAPTPVPVPVPVPVPTPTPVPVPVPVLPVPQSTTLYAVAIYSGNPQNPNEVTFAAVRDDPILKSQLHALNVEWFAYPSSSQDVDTYGWRQIVTGASTPMIVIFDKAHNYYDLKGNLIDHSRAPLTPPLTVADMVKTFKTMRGQ